VKYKRIEITGASQALWQALARALANPLEGALTTPLDRLASQALWQALARALTNPLEGEPARAPARALARRSKTRSKVIETTGKKLDIPVFFRNGSKSHSSANNIHFNDFMKWEITEMFMTTIEKFNARTFLKELLSVKYKQLAITGGCSYF
jgi:hypothetical protein